MAKAEAGDTSQRTQLPDEAVRRDGIEALLAADERRLEADGERLEQQERGRRHSWFVTAICAAGGRTPTG